MPAPSPLAVILLAEAYDREQAAGGTGLPFLVSVRSQLVAVALGGGQQMVSASTAGKAFAFATGWSVDRTADAQREAVGLWTTLTTAQITTLLTGPKARSSVVSFRGNYGYAGQFPNGFGGFCG